MGLLLDAEQLCARTFQLLSVSPAALHVDPPRSPTPHPHTHTLGSSVTRRRCGTDGTAMTTQPFLGEVAFHGMRESQNWWFVNMANGSEPAYGGGSACVSPLVYLGSQHRKF